MQIILENTEKRYNSDIIFKGINYTFTSNNGYAVLGSNGSGKSTLLKLLSSNTMVSKGKITYKVDDTVIEESDVPSYVSVAAPYMDLIEEMTPTELLNFYRKFKPLKNQLSNDEFIQKLNLNNIANKQIRFFSSGMKQRMKLALAILSDASILLLDEPTSNLDSKGVEWYKALLKENIKDRILVVCSNHQPDEYFTCTETLLIENYK